MIYKINDKFYIKVQGYYKEVDVKVNGDNLDITPVKNSEPIEVYGFEKAVKAIDMMTDKDELIKSLEKPMSKMNNKTEEKNTRYNSRI